MNFSRMVAHLRTPLHIACKYLLEDYVATLVFHGAQVNAVDKFDKLPLNYVENRTEPEAISIAEFLRENGAKSTWRSQEPIIVATTVPQTSQVVQTTHRNVVGWKDITAVPKVLILSK